MGLGRMGGYRVEMEKLGLLCLGLWSSSLGLTANGLPRNVGAQGFGMGRRVEGSSSASGLELPEP